MKRVLIFFQRSGKSNRCNASVPESIIISVSACLTQLVCICSLWIDGVIVYSFLSSRKKNDGLGSRWIGESGSYISRFELTTFIRKWKFQLNFEIVWMCECGGCAHFMFPSFLSICTNFFVPLHVRVQGATTFALSVNLTLAPWHASVW